MLLFVAAGPILGFFGHYLQLPILFWIGVTLAGANLFLDLASEVMNFPLIPLILIVICGGVLSPWWYGAAVGVLAWSVLDGLGMLMAKNSKTGPRKGRSEV
jgi:hypothetical protein